jgi:hypothetical protein
MTSIATDSQAAGNASLGLTGFWAPKVRILFVIDGRITEGHGEQEFGLGPPIDTLQDQSAVPWLDLDVTIGDRDHPSDFRLTQNNLGNIDQVWLFGDEPGEAAASDPTTLDSVIDDQHKNPLGEPELAVLANWMDGGGGVFATGDHSILGASMCHRIPRVRTMRAWTHAQGVPSLDEPDRHETLQHVPPASEVDQEGDGYAQRIFPVYQSVGGLPLAGLVPHPLLCGPHGVIDHFPDHMHEGTVFEDADVQLDQPLNFDGYSGMEYPRYSTPVLDALLPGWSPLGNRPVPHVVAHGLTTNTDAPPRSFGLVAAYDGQLAKVGRVVVDSTWHHWFSLNLHHFMQHELVIYEQLQWYYRNIAVYLATREQRAQMLFAAIWTGLLSRFPGAFSPGFSVWKAGQRALDVLGRNAPQCLVSELVSSVIPQAAPPSLARREGPHPGPDPYLTNVAITGGIALEMVERTNQVLLGQVKGHEVDEAEIIELGWGGVSRGSQALLASVDEGLRSYTNLRNALDPPEHT